MRKYITAACAAAAAAVSLVGCGGGGGGSSGPVAAASTFNLNAAVSNALTSGVSVTGLTATSGADTYTLSLSIQPQADAAFEGTTYKQARQTVTVNRNGAFAASGFSNVFFSLNPVTIRGAVDSDGEYSVYSQQTALPTAATVGQTGAVHFVTAYTSSAKTTVVSTQTVTWSLEADTATTAFACLNSSATFTNGSRVAEADCYKIDAAGQVLGAKATITINGTTLAFK